MMDDSRELKALLIEIRDLMREELAEVRKQAERSAANQELALKHQAAATRAQRLTRVGLFAVLLAYVYYFVFMV